MDIETRSEFLVAPKETDPRAQDFLWRQEQIMAEREAARIEREQDRLNGTEHSKGWHKDAIKQPGEQKPFDANAARLQMPERLKKPELPSLETLRDQIAQLITDLEASREDYANTSLDEYFAPQKAAERKVALLRQQLAEAEHELAQVTKPHPHEAYRGFVIEAERETSQLATVLLAVLSNNQALDKFGVPAERLSPEVRKDLSLRFADRLRKFGQFFTRTHRIANVNDEQLTARIGELVADLQSIIAENL